MHRTAIAGLILAASCAPAPAPAHARAAVTSVTRAYIEDLVAGRARWSDLVDPAVGVAFIQYTTSDSDPGIYTASSHLCGAAAVRTLEQRRAAFETAIQYDEVFRCVTSPGPPTCELGVAGEFAGKTRLVFATGGAGLRLDVVEDVNSSNAPADEAAVLARLRDQQRGARCP